MKDFWVAFAQVFGAILAVLILLEFAAFLVALLIKLVAFNYGLISN